jgi:hypothetical protein
MKTQKYKLSFTAASLSISESVNIAEVYLKCRDWNETKSIVRENNLLQSRTNSRTTRVLAEIIPRLILLSDDQLSLLVEGSLSEQKYLLWFTICKTYSLIKEFAVEVLHEKFLSRNMKVTDLDYDAFFNRKADWNEGLAKITTLTRKKIRQVVFHMMREADLLTDDNTILRAMLSIRLTNVLKTDAPMSFEIFPVDPY